MLNVLFASEQIKLTTKEQNWINKHIPITYVYDIDWAPFEWKNQVNRHTGIIADILKLIEKKAHITFKAINTNNWAEAVSLAKHHKVDMYSAIPLDKSRAKYMNFTVNDIFTYNACFVKNKFDKKNYSKNNFSNVKIAIVKSSSLGNFIKKKYPNAIFVEVNKTGDGFKQLEEGKVDLFGINSATAEFMINKKGYNSLIIAKKLNFTFRLKIAISKQMPKEVLSIIDKALQSINQNEIDAIYNKWMEPVVVKKELDVKLIFYIVVFIIILVLIFLYKQYLMKKSMEEFEQLFNSTMEAIMLFEYGSCIDANQVALNMFGYSTKDELLGLSPFDLTVKEFHTVLQQQLSLENTTPYEIKVLRKDGRVFDALIQGTNLKNRNLRLACILDISNIKRQEQIISEQSKLAAMGEMIGNIAHQWRQPLSVISTASTSIIVQKEYGTLEDERLIYSCNAINDNAQYLSKTIDDFKNFIKGDRKKELFNLKDNIDSFIRLVDGSIKSNNINLILDLQEDIQLNGYSNELKQCYINIFNNAKDALNENNIELKYIFIKTFIKNHKVIIQIKDNAGGIPTNILSKIFEPYFTTKHQSRGTGLGLNMTYNLIVEGMNGSIIASNEKYIYNDIEYTGALFTISLSM